MAQYELTTKQKQALRKEGHVSITRNGKQVRVTPSMVKGRRSHAKRAMGRFEFLTGDVNWKDYGGKWYRRTGDHEYYVIEFINWEDATGEPHPQGKYCVEVSSVDLSSGSAWSRNIPNALRCCGISRPHNEVEVLEAVHCYMGGDRDLLSFGNNADRLLADAKRRYS